ncbi:hypothetical protein R2R35_18700 [Anaerocolumna sp. AGMB13020]|uniref:hypothetical protein n=1 Tax=Anaerocolumna sp. AGMB13020 TaxID=3081750 RepID=UPI002952F5B9|nr:hypothetical protein [Anaerocolumna sp. AGMB13020]WOO35811.1 hypothetical protein R2R35_18700 [Anaerocolumna sp. AGMB13020]
MSVWYLILLIISSFALILLLLISFLMIILYVIKKILKTKNFNSKRGIVSLEKIQRLLTKCEPVLSTFASLVAIIVFINGIMAFPNQRKISTSKVEGILIGESFECYKQDLGIPQIVKTTTYPTYSGKRTPGYFAYNQNEYFSIIAYFKEDDSLLGYVVVSGDKSFKPYIGSSKQVKLNSTTFNEYEPYGPSIDSDEYKRMLEVNSSNDPTVIKYSNIDDYITSTGKSFISINYALDKPGYWVNKTDFYIEVFDNNSGGYLGLAYTDWYGGQVSRESKEWKNFINIIYDYELPPSFNYKKEILYTLGDEDFKNLKNYFNTKLKLGKLSPNSFFIFSNNDKEIDLANFFSERIGGKDDSEDNIVPFYFIDKSEFNFYN